MLKKILKIYLFEDLFGKLIFKVKENTNINVHRDVSNHTQISFLLVEVKCCNVNSVITTNTGENEKQTIGKLTASCEHCYSY